MAEPQPRMAVPARTAVPATATMLGGLALTGAVLPGDHALGVFTTAAVGVGLSLILSTALEASAGARNLIRVDILVLWVLYGLTLFEFLFPQPDADAVVSPGAAASGTGAVLLGFAGIVLGRHLMPRRGKPVAFAVVDVPPKGIFLGFVLAAVLGYLHMLMAVNFDPIEMLEQMSHPRFSQPWSRGRFGDASALLVEVGALIYLIPPIAGLVYARPKNYNLAQKLTVTIIIMLTMYYGFSSGTRNIFAVYVITFLGAYFLTRPKVALRHVIYLGVPTVAIASIGLFYMLEFRNVGVGNFSLAESRRETIFIDQNIVVVARLTDLFPRSYEFLGLEIPLNVIVRPVPRALWPSKPEGLSVTVESVMGANSQTTVSCTFIGEAYMSGGLIGVVLVALLLGAGAEVWNRVGSNIRSQFDQVVYASGFFCAAITMRSVFWLLPSILPTLALWLYGRYGSRALFSAPQRRRPARW